eukprot:554592-Pleurochrysis_carterae.AAC.1
MAKGTSEGLQSVKCEEHGNKALSNGPIPCTDGIQAGRAGLAFRFSASLLLGNVEGFLPWHDLLLLRAAAAAAEREC